MSGAQETPNSRMSYEEQITKLGIELPSPAAAAGNYVPAVRSGNLLFLSGALCLRDGVMTHTGPAGKDHDIASAAAGARVCALNLLTNIRAAVGSLDQVHRVISLSGFVYGVPGFADSPAVINGASDLMAEVFGDAGQHSRAAVAVAGLPKNSTVEIQAVVELVSS